MSWEAWGSGEEFDDNWPEKAADAGWINPDDLSRAELEVLRERARQKIGEGWTPAHDDTHRNGELAIAAGWYALNSPCVGRPDFAGVGSGQSSANSLFRDSFYGWPFALEWWKPRDARRDLVRAAALILAEIERLDRAAGDKAIEHVREAQK